MSSESDALIEAEQRRIAAIAKGSGWGSAAKVKAAENKIETARKAGRALTGSDMGKHEQTALKGLLARPKSFSRGGLVKKTGYAKVHKGERVLTRKQNKH